MRRLPATEFLSQCHTALLLDVRSPAEYRHAHIPGAVSLPLFTDEERKVVGTTYKQVSREAAIKIGLDCFGPKMRGMVETVERLTVDRWPLTGATPNNDRQPINVFLYCWRGGMRSSAVAWLLNLYGFPVTVLAGGYKAFRNAVLRSFEKPYPFKILGGYTGSGKTELLRHLKAGGEAVVDLEALASHKGSAFGNIGLPPQPSQEMFENLLGTELRNVSGEGSVGSGPTNGAAPAAGASPHTIWLEDESQRIGTVNLPNALWQAMRKAPLYFLEIPFEERLRHIAAGYGECEKSRLLDAVERIKKRLGGLETKTVRQFLEDGNTEEAFRILLRYYDKLYGKGLHARENLEALLTKIPCERVTAENATLLRSAKISLAHERTS